MNEIYDLKKIAAQIVEKLRERGADKVSCSVTSKETDEFNHEGGDFTLYRTLYGSSVSMTAILNGKKGSTAVNRFDEESIDVAVDDCITAALAADADEAWDIAPLEACPDGANFVDGTLLPDKEALFERTRELINDIGSRYPKIVIESLTSDYETAHTVYLNSNGIEYDVKRGYYSVGITYSAIDGDASTSFDSAMVVTDDLSRPFIECGCVADSLERTVRQLVSAPNVEKFCGTAVLMPDCLGQLLGTAIDNFAGDAHILDGTSIWRDKLGKQVTSRGFTVRLVASDDRLLAPEHFTGEGYPAEDYTLIEDGVLKCFDVSLYVANKTGQKRALNDSGTMLIDAEKTTKFDDIISGIEQGILVGRFSGGEPASNGDFSGVAKNSFLIENGKITGAAAETMISGNLADMLMNVRAVSAETVCDGLSVLPYVAFDGITVSGK